MVIAPSSESEIVVKIRPKWLSAPPDQGSLLPLARRTLRQKVIGVE